MPYRVKGEFIWKGVDCELQIILVHDWLVFCVEHTGGIALWVFVLTGFYCPEKGEQADNTNSDSEGYEINQRGHISGISI